MHVAVVIRNAVDCRVPLPADKYLEKPLPEGQVKIINPSDRAAFEQAVALKQHGFINKITVVNLGSWEEEESLRWCLADGADEALRLWDPTLAEADQLGRGKTLAAAFQVMNVELVLCGSGCLDQLNSLMPGIAAGIAEMAFVTDIEKVEKIESAGIIAVRRREKGLRERVMVKFPAVLTIVDNGASSVRKADLAATLAAFTSEIQCWDLIDLGLPSDLVGERGAKMTRIGVRLYKPPLSKPITPDVEMPAAQRLQAIVSGGAPRKQGEIVDGEPAKLVEKISEFLGRQPVPRL